MDMSFLHWLINAICISLHFTYLPLYLEYYGILVKKVWYVVSFPSNLLFCWYSLSAVPFPACGSCLETWSVVHWWWTKCMSALLLQSSVCCRFCPARIVFWIALVSDRLVCSTNFWWSVEWRGLYLKLYCRTFFSSTARFTRINNICSHSIGRRLIWQMSLAASYLLSLSGKIKFQVVI